MITAEERELRRHTAGASDAAAIVGCDPWRNAADVYWSKIAPLDDQPNAAMQIGNRLEPILLDWAEQKLEAKIERNVSLRHAELPLSANLDGRIKSLGVVEAKYVGPRGADFWGAPDTDEVPDHVALQVQQQMFVAGLRLAYVPAAICRPGGLSFEMFYLGADKDLQGDLVSAVVAWWNRHVVPRVPPGNCEPALEVLRRIRREPKSIVDLPGDAAVQAWETLELARATATAADKAKDEATARILSLLGDNEAGRLPDGRLLVYAAENAGTRLNLERLRLEHPKIMADYSTPTTRRILRLKKGASR